MSFKSNNYPPCFNEIGDNKCTGCAACANGCPQSAIEMVLNNDGFYRPLINKDTKCRDCLRCHQFCPAMSISKVEHQNPVPEVLAAWSTNENTHLQSSSGGIFSELANYVLDKKGIVCGCRWDQNWAPFHVMIKDQSELGALRGSKYVPSRIDETFYRKINELLKNDILILFCGTPCQVMGLRSIVKPALRKNLILVDLICHGVPSLKSFWKYLDWKFGGRNSLEYFSFRNKEVTIQTICAIENSGKKYLKACGKNSWFRSAMIYHLFLQPCCYACAFGSIPRGGDISLGDFWGIPKEWENPFGNSAVFINSAKGKALINDLIKADKITIKNSDYQTIANHIGRIRGVEYPIPRIRKISFFLIRIDQYQIFNLFVYQPLRFRKWLSGSFNRRIERVSSCFRQLQALWARKL